MLKSITDPEEQGKNFKDAMLKQISQISDDIIKEAKIKAKKDALDKISS